MYYLLSKKNMIHKGETIEYGNLFRLVIKSFNKKKPIIDNKRKVKMSNEILKIFIFLYKNLHFKTKY